MATKLQQTFDRLQTTLNSLSGYDEWTSFLKTAAWMYKYPFQDQVLIYSQRPDATACASIEVWNKSLQRWINKGAKGIALLHGDGSTYRLDYVFDVSDTNDKYGRDIVLWQYEDRHDDAIIETLQNTFGDVDDTTIIGAIGSAAHNAVQDNKSDYLRDLQYLRSGSLLNGLDNENLDVWFSNLAESSVAYMIMRRMGIEDTDVLFSQEDFPHIMEFSTSDTITILGSAAQSISETALRSISETIRAENKKFAFERMGVYNQSRTNNTNTTNIERNDKDDRDVRAVDVHDSGGLSAAEPDSTGQAVQDREIREPETDISQEPPQGTVHSDAGEGGTAPAPGGYEQGSNGDDREDSVTDGTERGSDGGAESPEPIDMDRLDEQFSPFSRGDGSEGRGVQLNLFDVSLPSEEEQRNSIEAEQTGSAFKMRNISQQMIDEVLTTGANDQNSVLDICVQYSKNKSAEDNIEFLKREYGIGGKGFVIDGAKVAALWDDKGIKIARGDRAVDSFGGELITWDEAGGRIKELLELGRFAAQETLDKMRDHEISKAASAFWYMHQDVNYDDYPQLRGVFDPEWFNGGFPDSTARIAELMGTEEGINSFIAAVSPIAEQYAQNTSVMRFKLYSPDKILQQLTDLKLEHLHFTANEYQGSTASRFITEDELDNMFVKYGSGVADGKLRTYMYFKEHTDKKERISFLKNEYGIGGHYSEIFSESHDGKGISFSRGDILSPLAKVTLTWNAVERRIDKLIKDNKYLSEHEQNVDLPRYQSEQEQSRIRRENIDNPALLDKAKQLIDEFCEEEYGDGYGGDYTDLHKVSLAYTTTEDGISEIQVDADLVDYRIIKYVDNHEIEREQFKDLYDMIEHGLSDLNFDELVFVYESDIAAVVPETSKEYELGYGRSGNGTTVWNRLEEVNGDYKTIAHIEDNGEVTFYEELPEEIKQEIEKQAAYEREIYQSINGNSQRTRRTIAQINYDILSELAPEIMSGEARYMRFQDKSMMPLIIERLSDTRISVAHTYIQEGDVMYDPEMEFEIDTNTRSLSPRTYRQDNMGIYQYVEYDNGILNTSLVSDFNSFARTWFKNIENTNYVREHMTVEVNGEDISISYDYSGTISEITGEEEAVRQYKAEHPIPKKETEQRAETIPMPQPQRPKPAANTVIYPELTVERHNFRITDDNFGVGGPKEKFRNNVAAIELQHTLEAEHRLATPEEQEVLSRYVGWGGLADAFDSEKESWRNEYTQLKSILLDTEYNSARESTLTAFYTPPVVIRAVYNALEGMGLKQANILDPAMGIGNFEGMLPDSLSDCKMYGIEIDNVSGRIAQQLYQKNSVAIQGYEDSTLPDSFFDAAVGNVPFGDFKVMDKRYDKHNFLIHDYFFAKTIDKVRPGGVIAFITSSGTMDKRNSNVRKYIAQRAELIGAIRLPDNTFKAAAGTEVTSDILFLQKRDRMTDIEPDWVYLGTNDNGYTMNQYFIDNPDMILGEMTEESGPFGPQMNCKAYEGADLNVLLNDAIQNIHAQITEYEIDDVSNDEDMSIPADPNVKNFSYTIVDGDIYFRENSRMNKVDVSLTAQNRIKGLIEIRDCVRELIEYQTEDYPEHEIKAQQDKLNRLYDNYTAKYGLINSRGNNMAFSDDSSYFLLCSLEVIDENGELERKADMFTRRTIGARTEVTHVDTASEALAISIGEKARIDMEYMSQLTGMTEQELFEDLKGVIFLNPLHASGVSYQEKYLTADEYLSGNVRDKLEWAKRSMELYPEDYAVNVAALTEVQPKDLTASEITVRLGTTWIPPEYIKDFVFELLEPSYYASRNIDIKYSKITGAWAVSGKKYDRMNVKSNSTYGTQRVNAYSIIEDSLNLKDVRIFDYVENEKGNRVAVLNKEETTIAQQKQDLIKNAFDDWIWKDPERREALTKLYNEKFNSVRPREYDGSHIQFVGMNPEIQLRQHQKNAVARIMYGGNSLLGHVVGAGKTWTMAAAAMEMKRLGLCSKSLFVVPNHLTEQWAAEFLQLYPAANILVATKKDFETKNRKKFCGRIATGDYDAIIIGHSQFEKIPMSIERQIQMLEKQRDEIMDGIIEAKANRDERFTVKQLEKTKRGIDAKLKKLNDTARKDDVVTFEELGIDRLFVDESHYYKNLYLYTKMRNVGGIAQTEAQKSSDMFMKCRYLDELTGNKGCIMATGTPISNSMVEMYTVQRYLQYDTLARNDLQHFDAWASTFGETVTAIELAPEGSGYRAKTRFAKFFNLPELMVMFKEVADIQTADMLNLPVPEAEYHNVAVQPTDIQREMVADLSDRAEKVRNRVVDPSEDNMLKITNDGRKLALDQRMIDPLLADETETKVNACISNVYDIWERTAADRSAQLVFCDLSTPKGEDEFSVYTDIRKKLIERGVPEGDIAFIHDADTDVKKKELFSKVRKGDVRILLGSTQKMGAGTNVQTRLIALHDLDCPWRPSDLEQRSGRIIRQGNNNDKVHIYRYVTKDTFDAYMFQLVEHKQKFIAQVMTSKSPVRSAEDIDETALSYAEIKALATGNPHIKEKMELDTQVAKLKLIKSSFMSQKYDLEDKVVKYYPQEIAKLTELIAGAEKDIVIAEQHPKPEEGFNPMTIDGKTYSEKEPAGKMLIERCKAMTSPDPVMIGEYRGFKMILSIDTFHQEHKMTLQGMRSYTLSLGTDVFGNIQRIDNAISNIPTIKKQCETKLEETKKQFENAKVESKKEFPQEAELAQKLKRLAALDALLNMDKREHEGVDMTAPEDMGKDKYRGMER